jgi:hypothetical protein
MTRFVTLFPLYIYMCVCVCVCVNSKQLALYFMDDPGEGAICCLIKT